MADFQSLKGGNAVTAPDFVATDGKSIVGDGTNANPLSTVLGGVGVVTDGTSITGDGTAASPLQAGTTNAVLVAEAVVNSDGSFLEQSGNVSFASGGTGIAVLTINGASIASDQLAYAVALRRYVPSPGPAEPGFIEAEATGASEITVYTWNATPTPTNMAFSILVYWQQRGT